MSTKDKTLFVVDPTAGINQERPSQMVGGAAPNSWFYAEGFRVEDNELMYVPGERNLQSYEGYGHLILAIIPVIQPGATGYNLLVLTEAEGFLLAADMSDIALAVNGGANQFDFGALGSPEIYYNHHRWSYFLYGGVIFFTNLLNKVSVFRYNAEDELYELRTLDDTNPITDDIATIGTINNLQPKAKYILMLDGHIVCAHTRETHYWDGNSIEALPEETTYSGRFRWSQRDVLGQNLYDWTPGTGSNADFLDVQTSQTYSEYGTEITGFQAFRNVAIGYTRSAIYELSYVGLPSKMRLRTITSGVGCHYPYSVASAGDLHFFIGADNFYAFNGSSVSPIGDKIWKVFKYAVNPDREVAEKTWSWVRASAHQVWWFFISRDSYADWAFNKALIYDWITGSWHIQRVRAPLSVVELNTRVNNDEETETSIVRALMYGTGEVTIMRELNGDDNPFDFQYYNDAILISQDFQFDDPEAVKDLTRIYIDAEVEAIIIDHEEYKGKVYWGIGIYVSVRDYVSDPFHFEPAGFWQRYRPGTDGFPQHVPLEIHRSGRIINFAFVPGVAEIITDEESEADLAILFEQINANV
jgi:hypothetical protein